MQFLLWEENIKIILEDHIILVFFLSENLKLYSFNSTKNIPQVLKTYTMIIEISFDPCKLEDRGFFTKEEEKLKNKPYQNDISLTTIIDSLIKEVIINILINL